jgi:hypothetical protein
MTCQRQNLLNEHKIGCDVNVIMLKNVYYARTFNPFKTLWFLYVPPNTKNCTLFIEHIVCPVVLKMNNDYLPEQHLVIIMQMKCSFCEVGTKFLNIISKKFIQ